MNDVAGIDLAETDAPADRRGDRRIAELRLSVLDPGLVGGDGRVQGIDLGLLLIDRLLGAGALLNQVLEAREVLRVGHELRLVLRLLGLGLIEYRLERPGIDDRQHVARLDALPFGEIHALQLAVNLAVDRHCV